MSVQGVEGIRGRQGLEGPKGEEVSSYYKQTRLQILLGEKEEFTANEPLP